MLAALPPAEDEAAEPAATKNAAVAPLYIEPRTQAGIPMAAGNIAELPPTPAPIAEAAPEGRRPVVDPLYIEPRPAPTAHQPVAGRLAAGQPTTEPPSEAPAVEEGSVTSVTALSVEPGYVAGVVSTDGAGGEDKGGGTVVAPADLRGTELAAVELAAVPAAHGDEGRKASLSPDVGGRLSAADDALRTYEAALKSYEAALRSAEAASRNEPVER
jgi:hypothetical protein